MIRSHHFTAILPATESILAADAAALLDLLKTSVAAVNLRAVSQASATFTPQGVSVVVILEESHVALHVWTECRRVTVDIHVCDYSQDNFDRARRLSETLTQQLSGGDRADWHYWLVTDEP